MIYCSKMMFSLIFWGVRCSNPGRKIIRWYFFEKLDKWTICFFAGQKLLSEYHPAYQWHLSVFWKQRRISAYYLALKVMNTLRCNVASEQSIRNLNQVEIQFGFWSLNIVQVATTHTEREMADSELQMSKRQQFVNFQKQSKGVLIWCWKTDWSFQVNDSAILWNWFPHFPI